jgi:hypothetical protein
MRCDQLVMEISVHTRIQSQHTITFGCARSLSRSQVTWVPMSPHADAADKVYIYMLTLESSIEEESSGNSGN